jgi:hypothetical protein
MTIELYKYIYKNRIYDPSMFKGTSFCVSNITVDYYKTIKCKYETIKNIIHTTWIPIQSIEKMLNDLHKCNKIYFSFIKLYHILCKNKAKKYDYHCDLYGNNLSNINNNSKITLLEDNVLYTFTINDIIKIINNKLSNTCYGHVTPNTITNPYTNKDFSIQNLHYIYNVIKKSDYEIPLLFIYFKICDFNIVYFKTEYNYEIYEYSIKNLIKSMSKRELVFKINSMIQNLKYVFKLINISDGFPEDILIKAFKPFLKIYLIIINTRNNSKWSTLKTFFVKKVILFNKNNYTFGRKMFKIINKSIIVDNTFKTINTRIAYFCKEYTPFYSINIKTISNLYISRNYNSKKLAKCFVQLDNESDIDIDSDNDSIDSDETSTTQIFYHNIMHSEFDTIESNIEESNEVIEHNNDEEIIENSNAEEILFTNNDVTITLDDVISRVCNNLSLDI